MRRREFGQLAAAMTAMAAMGLAGCGGSGGGADGEVTLEFAQWWEPELPDGTFRALMDKFEEQNPGIKVELLSGPYASTKEQLVAGAAAGTMPDVVGIDGAWVNDFAKQGAIADLTALMGQEGYDDSELASQIQYQGATYMIPVVNFVYPLFANTALLTKAGVTQIPSTREEFAAAAKAVTGGEVSGWALPLSLEAPNGIQNDVMSWVWASGGSMLTGDGKPNLKGNADVRSAAEFIKKLWDDGVVSPGAFTMKEQDKVEDFTNARTGLMIDSLAHVNTIREGSPDLAFDIAAIPARSGYTGRRGMPYASWGIGVSGTTEHAPAAWKLVAFLHGGGRQRRARQRRQGVPRQQQGDARLRQQRRDVQEGLRHLELGHARQRVHRPAGLGDPHAQVRRAAPDLPQRRDRRRHHAGQRAGRLG